VRTPDQSQTISFLPSLAVIPLETTAIGKRKLLSFKTDDAASALALSRSSAASSFFVKNKPFSEIAESYRALRTSVLLSSMGGPPKVILVTSALPQEGKSTTCINCAAVLAQQGSRVLLIDADMRRPKIQSALGIEPALGLSNLLTGSATIEDVVTPVLDIPNLFAIVSGPIPPQPAELLGSELMDKYLDLLRGQFDHIIIDSPPALSVTDSVILSAKVDSVVIVVLAGRTRKEALRRVAQLFTQVNAKVMGTVMNGVDLSSPDHYYYKYGKRYNTNYYRDSEVIESE